VSLGPGDPSIDCWESSTLHDHHVDLYQDLPSEEQLGDLPCWVIVQIPSLMECLDLEIDWNSLVGELVWTLATDALSQEDDACMSVRDCFRVAEQLTGFSVWDRAPRADGDS